MRAPSINAWRRRCETRHASGEQGPGLFRREGEPQAEEALETPLESQAEAGKANLNRPVFFQPA